MSETKTTILQIQIDRQDANKALQETEKNLIGLKAAQKSLNEEIKQGKITQDEYVQGKIKLDAQIKEENQSRQRLQQAVASENNSLSAQKALLADLISQREKINTGTKEGAEKFEQLTGRIKELNDSMLKTKKESGGLSEAFLQFAERAKVGEFELGKLAGLLPLIASPALAAGSAIAALGAAYASSAAGGKDLEEAQNRIKAQWEVFAGAIGGEIGQGEGLISTVTKYVLGIGKGFIAAAGDVISFGQGGFIQAAEADEKQIGKVALAYNKITELQFEQMQNEVLASQQRKQAFELVQKRSDTELQITERIKVANQIVDLQKKSVENSVEALKQQAQQLLIIGELTNNNVRDENNISPLRKQYLQILVQINSEESARARRISQAEVAARNLTNQLQKQNELLDKQNRKEKFGAEQGKSASESDTQKRLQGTLTDADINVRISKSKLLSDSLKKIDQDYEQAKKDSIKSISDEEKRADADQQKITQDKIRRDAANINSLRQMSILAKTILGSNTQAYKTFSSAEAVISTYAAADKALEIYGPTPVGFAAMAAAIAEGLANVLQINNVKFSEGGYTGDGSKYQPAGIVHAGEIVWSQKDVASVGGPSIANAMRPTFKGYAEGGLVTNQMSTEVNKEIMLQDMFKNMPQPIVSWKEGLIVDARIKYKEGIITS